MVALIDRLAENTGLRKEDVIRLAVLLLDQVQKNEANGGHAALFDQDGNKTRLVLPPV
jgi:enamine deaminase RidA (YjgF/YER057c/UK114 family)